MFNTILYRKCESIEERKNDLKNNNKNQMANLIKYAPSHNNLI